MAQKERPKKTEKDRRQGLIMVNLMCPEDLYMRVRAKINRERTTGRAVIMALFKGYVKGEIKLVEKKESNR